MSVPGETLYFKFTSRDAGVPFTLAGSPAVSVYKGSSTTESTAGVTLTVDFDGRTGLNHVTIDTSADGTFYSAGGHFELVITTGTVNGNSVVGEVVGSFDLADVASATLGVNVVNWRGNAVPATSTNGVPLVDVKYWLGTVVSTPTVAGVPNVNVKTWNDLTTVALPLVPTTAGRTLDVSATGEAGIDWANVGSPTTVVGLSGTTIKDATDVETTLATIAGYVDTEVAAIKAKTDQLTFTGGNVHTDAKAIDASTAAAQLLKLLHATLETGTAQAGGASSITLRAGASSVNDLFKDEAVWIASGTGAGQTNRITAYNGTTKVATVGTAWVTQPDATSVYVCLGRIG